MPCILLLPRWSIADGCTWGCHNAICPSASLLLYMSNVIQTCSNVLSSRRVSPDHGVHACKQGSEDQVRKYDIVGDTTKSVSIQRPRWAAHDRSGLALPAPVTHRCTKPGNEKVAGLPWVRPYLVTGSGQRQAGMRTPAQPAASYPCQATTGRPGHLDCLMPTAAALHATDSYQATT